MKLAYGAYWPRYVEEKETFVQPADASLPMLEKLSIVIPARNEEGCIASTVSHLNLELKLYRVPHEIVVVDDGSTDRTWPILQELRHTVPELVPLQNNGLNGFGRAIICGLDKIT